MAFEIGQRVGDYEVQKLLGVGGMGHVYLVRNIISNRTEAMKVLLPDLTAEPDLATRFISEIRTLAGFDHPNIAQLRTAFQANNQLIMMMEFVEGYTLEQLATQRRMTVDEVANYVSQALSALAYAHQHGVVHRDIKPANLMVTSHGIVKLMDFGIAKSTTENINHTKPGTTIGSLHYMSPEQVRGGQIDARSDLYSIGIVLYELLAGRRPFEAETTFSILNAQLNTAPQPPIELNPALPTRLNEIILTALAKDPAQRFPDAEAFRTALKPFRDPALAAQDNLTTPMAAQAQPLAATLKQPAPEPAWQQQPTPPPPPPQQQQQPYTAAPGYGPPPSHPPAPNYAYAAPQQNYQQPPRRSGGNKPLWIGIGAVAAALALAAVGFGLPRYMKTHAASNTTTTPDASHAPDAVVTTTPTQAPVTAPLDTTTIPVQPNTSTSNAGSTSNLSANTGNASANLGTKSTSHTGSSSLPNHGGQQGNPIGNGGGNMGGNNGGGNVSPQQPVNNAEIEQAEEHLMQSEARANTAKRGVGQIRSQQEAMGLGLRGDVESAESRLDSYLRAADNEVRRGNAAAANRNIEKADAELAILEKFLGH